jgi:NhaP-type Na+/H+ or K+/H+ antiporter
VHDHEVLIFAALMVFLFGLVSKASERWLISGPMVFVTVGVLVGPVGLDLFHLNADAATVTLIAEITLMLILFVDGSLINVKVIKQTKLPVRLLGIGLPLTMLLGFALGALMFGELGLWAAALIALVLSPTDAALGQAVVKSEIVRDDIRQSISMESGLNDGIALPPILVCFAALGAESSGHEGAWLGFMAMQLTLGPLVGVAVGLAGGWLLQQSTSKGWMEGTFERLAALSLALVSFALAEAVGGNGFIAAFCAGLAMGARELSILHTVQEAGEAEGTMLSLGVFLLFGLAAIPLAVEHWGWLELGYAVLCLTVIRMVPVALALIGSKEDKATVLFVGWFGPRGIASVLYLLLAAAAIGVEGNEQLMAVIVLTVTLSVFAHGLSAVPLCARYANRSHASRVVDSS